LGGGGSIGASLTDGMLSLNISGSLDLGIGIDFNLTFSVNIDAVGDLFTGTNTSYTQFVNPQAAAAREAVGLNFVQQAQQVAESEQNDVTDMLSGVYNDNPAGLQAMVTEMKMQEQILQNDAAQQGFTILRNADGTFTLNDHNPPATEVITVHNNGLDDLISGLF
jgi:hypothetical protein